MADSFEGVKRFLETEKKTGNCGAVFEWFNVELKEPLGLDIYQYEFDKMRGYQIIEKDNIELLLIKLEKLDEFLPHSPVGDDAKQIYGVHKIPSQYLNAFIVL